MKTKLFFTLMALCMFLVACQPNALPPIATIQPIIATEEAPTSEATPLTLATATNTPEPTPVSVEPTPSPIEPIQSEPTPVELTLDELIELVLAASTPTNVFSSTSPDGQWQANIVRYDCVQVDPVNEGQHAYEQLLITRVNDGTQTLVAEQLQGCGRLGAWGLNGFYWSSNSHYYYFDYAREGGPDGMPCWLWSGDFSRVNVETGLVERVPGNGSQVSPEGIILGWDEQDIVIWRLNDGEIGRIPFAVPTYTLHSLQLSPTGDQFVYVLGNDCIPALSTHALVILVSVADLAQTTLVDSDNVAFHFASWETNNLIFLSGTDGQDRNFDLIANELITLTPSAP